MGQIRKNKVIYSGGEVNALGVFIDTDNVIKASTTIARDTTETYTATEDCIVIASYYGGNNDGNIKINNVAVSLLYVALPVNGVTLLTDSIPLKKGQTISITTRTYDGSYVVYGIQPGTENIPEYHIYSTDEKIVGEWIDGSFIYEKTYSGLNIQVQRKGEWAETGISATNMSKIIDGTMRDTYGQKLDGVIGFVNSNAEIGIVVILDNRTITNITVRYTKSA